MTNLRVITLALMAGAATFALAGPARAKYLCGPALADQPTTAEFNMAGAVGKVFLSRWLPEGAVYPGTVITVQASGGRGFRCADVTVAARTQQAPAGSARYKLFLRPSSTATYELDTAAGEMVGSIAFDSLSGNWRVNHAITYYGVPGARAVCDGPASPPSWMINGVPYVYAPGRCMDNYGSVRYEDLPAQVKAAMDYIFTNLTAPAEIRRNF